MTTLQMSNVHIQNIFIDVTYIVTPITLFVLLVMFIIIVIISSLFMLISHYNYVTYFNKSNEMLQRFTSFKILYIFGQ